MLSLFFSKNSRPASRHSTCDFFFGISLSAVSGETHFRFLPRLPSSYCSALSARARHYYRPALLKLLVDNEQKHSGLCVFRFVKHLSDLPFVNLSSQASFLLGFAQSASCLLLVLLESPSLKVSPLHCRLYRELSNSFDGVTR